MTAPLQFKLGWDREKLAEYMLSRISFIAKPSTVSDDLGSDLFCTLFRLEGEKDHEYRLPLSTFAVQIRSSDITAGFSPNIQYLQNLEIPFFWGVLDENHKRLTLFSGENLPIFFHHYGEVQTLKIKPLEREQMGDARYHPMEPRKYNYTVMFPKVLHMDINSTREDLNGFVNKLHKMCLLMHRNIAACTTKEYIFECYDEHSVIILAGSDSAQHYLDNFIKRLAGNFYNLEWIIPNNLPEDDRDAKLRELLKAFKIYEDTYLRIRELYPRSIPKYLEDKYSELRDILNKTYDISQLT